jgi:hypothetical protein
VLLAAFMAGLAVGSFVLERIWGRGGPTRAPRLALATSLGVTGALLGAGAVLGLVGASLILVATGALVGAVLAEASLAADDPSAVVAPLYAADLLGGAAGALATSLVLVPGVGLAGTALGVAGLCLLSTLL